jgi:hypothetical protein
MEYFRLGGVVQEVRSPRPLSGSEDFRQDAFSIARPPRHKKQVQHSRVNSCRLGPVVRTLSRQ